MTSVRKRPRALFLSNVAWDYLWQRHQAMAVQFANDFEVCFVEIPGIRRLRLTDLPRIWRRLLVLCGVVDVGNAGVREPVPEGVRIARPFVLPSTNAFFDRCNRALVRRWIRKRRDELAAGVDIIVTYTASSAGMAFVEMVPHRRLVYECTDNFAAVEGVPRSYLQREAMLLARADLTIVPSMPLAERHGLVARRIEVLPHGVAVERFLPDDRADDRPVDRPVTLIYYGHMHRQHFDFPLVDGIARARPDWRVKLVGPVINEWKWPPNVEVMGAQAHERLREFILASDVILLPYMINDYTRCVLPAKTFECLATGLPIVATPLPEIVRVLKPFVSIAKDVSGFVDAVEKVMEEKDSRADREKRIMEAQGQTWRRRYQQVQEWLRNIEHAV